MSNRNSSQKSSGRSPPRGYSSSSTIPSRRYNTSQNAAPTMVQQQRPSLFKEMAATAGGVAVGSAIRQPDKVVVVQHQQPGMAKTFGATAAGVAVGSAVGHTVGQAITGGIGSHDSARQGQAQQPPADQMTEPTGPCAWEIKQFLHCAQSQTDLTVCQGFNEAIKQCKITHGIK